ncbi:MAG: peroxiredoxin [Lewinellaceae bacterium]|nr:peroxiredoxin [Saprospiraceae bacterium]MCB9338680.1 peroxiredoxin [Lewinellaceae bacterium]
MIQPPIKIGDRVPDFSLKNQHGEMVSVQQFLGKPFVIYFYPKDDTPGCTKEACSFRDAYAELRELDAEVIGISADSPKSHMAFAKKYDLPFVLLSDKGNLVRKLFGVKGSLFGLLPGRVTYIVDEKGVVQHVFDSQMQAEKHVREALEQLKKQAISIAPK